MTHVINDDAKEKILSPSQVVSMLLDMGVHLSVEEGKLKANSNSPLSDNARSIIKANKERLVSHLSAAQALLTIQAKTVENEAMLASFCQKRLWIIDEINDIGSNYNQPILLRLDGDINVDSLEVSFRRVIERHSALRTIFSEKDAEVYQTVNSQWDFNLQVEDLSACSQQHIDSSLRELVDGLTTQVFDLSKDLLIRASLIDLGNSTHDATGKKWVLAIIVHHIAFDAKSINIFCNELSFNYEQLISNKDDKLPPLAVQYADYALWQRHWLTDEKVNEQLHFWKNKLIDIPSVHSFPLDKPRPEKQTFNGRKITKPLSKSILEKIENICLSKRVTKFSFLNAVFNLLLSRYCGNTDIVVASPTTGRNRTEIQDVIGFFSNTVVNRTIVSKEDVFSVFLERFNESHINVQSNTDIPFEQIVNHINPERSNSYTPLAQVAFSLEDTLTIAGNRDSNNHIDIENSGFETYESNNDSATIRFEIELNVRLSDGLYEIDILYNHDLFEKSRINAFISDYICLIERVCQNPNYKIQKYFSGDLESRKETAEKYNQSGTTAPTSEIVHQWFELTANVHNDSTALEFASFDIESQSQDEHVAYEGKPNVHALSYANVNNYGNALASLLINTNLEKDSIVSLVLDRSMDMSIAALGILKSGCAYLPIDPTSPDDRIEFMMSDADVEVIVTQRKYQDKFTSENRLCIFIEDVWAEAKDKEYVNPQIDIKPDNLFCVIYTSGSTGVPKGVAVSHKNISYTLSAFIETFNISSSDRFLTLASNVFDISILETLSALLVGGVCRYIDKAASLSTPEIQKSLETATVFHAVPSYMNQVVSDDSCYPLLRLLLTGGDSVPESLLTRLKACLPSVQISELYGPTESSIICSYSKFDNRCENHKDKSHLNIIGVPLHHKKIYILDEYQEPVPTGVVGEIYVGGSGVSRGYIKRPRLTAENYIPDEYSSLPGARLYRTGDIGKYFDNGDIAFLGRSDEQTKIRGFRVEIGEVEAALNRCSHVAQSVVLVDTYMANGDSGSVSHKRLIAFVVMESMDDTVEKDNVLSGIRTELSAVVPDYMIPNVINIIDNIPLTSNGKVDIKSLRNSLTEPQDDVINSPVVSSLERKLLDIWEDILGIQGIHPDNNFFALGGDSILLIHLVSRINRVGIRVDVHTVFKNPTVSSLARSIGDTYTPIQHAEPNSVEGSLNLTPIQKYFFSLDKQNAHHDNQAIMVAVDSAFGRSDVESIVEYLITWHDALRLQFVKNKDGWHGQYVDLESIDIHEIINVFDLSTVSHAEKPQYIKDKNTQLQASLSLDKPLIRFGLYEDSEQSNYLIIILHHLIVDSVSWRILFDDISEVAQSIKDGNPMPSSNPSDSFQQWGNVINEYAKSQILMDEKSYWLEQQASILEDDNIETLQDYHPLTTPNVRSSETVTMFLSKHTTDNLINKCPSQFKASVDEILLSTFARAFNLWAAERGKSLTNVSVFLEGHGRTPFQEDGDIFGKIDFSKTLGWFTSIFPFVINLNKNNAYFTLLQDTKKRYRNVPRSGIGYGVLKYLTVDEDMKYLGENNAQIVFNYLGKAGTEDESNEVDDNKGRGLGFSTSTQDANQDILTLNLGSLKDLDQERTHILGFNGSVVNGSLTFDIDYSHEQFEHDSIQSLADYLVSSMEDTTKQLEKNSSESYILKDFPLARITEDHLDVLCQKYSIEDIYPATAMQKGLLFHTEIEKNSGAYVTQFEYTLSGDIDAEILKAAWHVVVLRNPVFRTAFYGNQEGELHQIIQKTCSMPWYFSRFSDRNISLDEQINLFEEYREKDKKTGFDINIAPLMRFALFEIGMDASRVQSDSIEMSSRKRFKCLWSIHHALLDGWSIPIVISQVLEAYDSINSGVPYNVNSSLHYKNYLEWLVSQDAEAAGDFWQEQVKDISKATSIGIDEDVINKSKEPTFKEYKFELPEEATNNLNNFAKNTKTTVSTVFQAAWALILSQYSGDSQVCFGVTTSGRPAELSGVDEIVGLLINTVPCIISVDKNTSLESWLHDIHSAHIERDKHSFFPLVDIVKYSQVNDGNIFDSLLVFENYPLDSKVVDDANNGFESGDSDSTQDVEMESFECFEETNYKLTLVIAPSDKLQLKLMYQEGVIKDDAIERLSIHFTRVINQIISSKIDFIEQVDCLCDDERNQIMQINRDLSTIDKPHVTTINELFEESCLRYKDTLCLKTDDGQWSYLELNAYANRLARLLLSEGVTENTLVGIHLNRSFEMVASILAISKAGGAYVPLDPNYGERVEYILKDSDIKVLITESQYAGRYTSSGINEFIVDTCKLEGIDSTDIDHHSEKDKTRRCPDPVGDKLAYVVYTSGSTGNPKGIAHSHNAITNLMWAQSREGYLNDPLHTLQFASLNFDVSLQEMMTAWYTGSSLSIICEDSRKDIKSLADYIYDKNIQRMFAPPSVIQTLFQTFLDKENPLREIIVGGEPLIITKDLLRFKEINPNCKIINHYGPSETHVASAYCLGESEEDNTEKSKISIGKPVNNLLCYVIGKNKKILPFGIPGELYIGGTSLAREYLNREKLTSEKYVPDFINNDSESRLYRTGDLVRLMPDGNMYFLRRLDEQVKIRGFRVEPGEIESTIAKVSGVGLCAVVTVDKNETPKLVAYLSRPNDNESGKELEARVRSYLNSTLPHYMRPSAIIVLDRLPFSQNGKIDKKQLEQLPVVYEKSENFIKPTTPTETTLAGIWAQVLKLDNVTNIGINDNFFEMGGHSILAMQITARIENVFRLELPLKELFDKPSIFEIAKWIDLNLKNKDLPLTSVLSKKIGDKTEIPLSFAQERLWFLDKLEPDNFAYHMPAHIELNGRLDEVAFEKSVRSLVARHETLRTVFYEKEHKPFQKVCAESHCNYRYCDLSEIEDHERENIVQGIEKQVLELPFDLTCDPMLRVALIKLSENKHELFYNMHHIVSDLVSNNIIFEEMFSLYNAFASGKENPLKELVIQYSDFSYWQRKHVSGARLKKQTDYWKKMLSGTESLSLPTDYPRPPMKTYDGDLYGFTIDADITQTLKGIGEKNNSTLFMVLLAGFNILLSRYSGQKDFCVGVPIANRTRIELESLVGFFVNTLAIRSNLEEDQSFVQLLECVKNTTLGAYSNQDIPFEKVVDLVKPERRMDQTPIFQVMLAFEPELVADEKDDASELESVPKSGGKLISKFDITMFIQEDGDGLTGRFEYNTDLFNRSTIKNMIDQFKCLLSGVVNNPNRLVLDYELLQDDHLNTFIPLDSDKKDVVYGHCDADPSNYCFPLVHQAIEAITDNNPDKTALVFDRDHISYIYLEEKANKLSHFLINEGLKQGDYVGVCLERSIDLFVSLLAILKSGAAYLPLEPTLPKSRLEFMIEDAKPSIILSTSLVKLKSNIQHECILLDKQKDAINASPKTRSSITIPADNPIYIIYTSGSTGNPKGVINTHAGVANRLHWHSSYFKFDKEEIVLHKTPFSFDVSGWEFYASLMSGGKTVIAKPELHKDSHYISNTIIREGITSLHFVPSMLDMMLLDQQIQDWVSIKNIFCSGEALMPMTVNKAYQLLNLADNSHRPKTEIYNLYGPTEAAIDVSVWRCDPDVNYFDKVLIGQAIDNVELYVLDNNHNICPFSVVGELYISGVQLAKSYINNPDLTQEKFITWQPKISKGNLPTKRLYATGDLVRRLSSGDLEYLGRKDDQVKIRGFRIELGEIENAILKNNLVSEVVVLPDSTHNQLIAFVNANDDALKKSCKNSENDQVNSWKDVFEDTYSSSDDEGFNLSGWNSSYTGEEYSSLVMENWVDSTVARILDLNPKNIYEIGCGTGLLLYKLYNQCDHYIGVDLSRFSIDKIKETVIEKDIHNVSVSVADAMDLPVIDEKSIDTIVINSTVQYFPSIEYLVDVISNSITLLKSKGKIFLGDIINYDLLNVFYCDITLQNESGELDVSELITDIENKVTYESELAISPSVIKSLKFISSRIERILVNKKRGKSDSEMTNFRYDVVIEVSDVKEVCEQKEPYQSQTKTNAVEIINWNSNHHDISWLTSTIEMVESTSICIRDIPNKRLNNKAGIYHLQNFIDSTEQSDIDDFIKYHENNTLSESLCIEPEDVFYLLEQKLKISVYTYEVVWSQDKKTMDVYLWNRDNSTCDWKNTEAVSTRQAFMDFAKSRVSDPLRSYADKFFFNEIKACISDQLPEYMLPNIFSRVLSLPRTHSGKINRRELLNQNIRLVSNETYEDPEGDVETSVASTWQDLLQVPKVGRKDNFFDLGGHSLLATQAVSRLQNMLSIEIPLKVFFENPTVISLSSWINNSSGHQSLHKIEQCVRDRDLYPLSFSQERLWFLSRLEKDTYAYHMPGMLKIDERIDFNCFKKAASEVVRRHESLRTIFTWLEGKVWQRVLDQQAFQVVYTDIVNGTDSEKDDALKSMEYSITRKPFDLTVDIPIRVGVVRTEIDESYVIFNIHHIASDLISNRIFFDELTTLYIAYKDDLESPLQPLELQYIDFSVWQREHLEDTQLRLQEDYWQTKLKGIKPIELPIDKRRPAMQTYNGHRVDFAFSEDLTRDIKALSHAQGVTVFMTLLAGFKVMLSRYSSQSDVIVGTPVSNRNRSELEGLIGFFVNTVALRSHVSGGLTFTELLQSIRKSTTEAFSNQDVSFEKVVEIVQPVRSLNRSPIFQVMLTYENATATTKSSEQSIVKPFDFDFFASKYELTFNPIERDDIICGSMEFNTDLFHEDTISRMLENLEHLFKQIVKNPYELISKPEMLSDDEQKLLESFNDNKSILPVNNNTCEFEVNSLVEAFEQRVNKQPDAIALSCDGLQITYRELNKRSNIIAHALIDKGVKPETPIVLSCTVSESVIIGIFAILKAGAAYVPIDPTYPKQRIDDIVTASEVTLALVDEEGQRALDFYEGVETIVIPDIVTTCSDKTNPSVALSIDNLAYIIYTSGSTGKPKGVLITHDNVLSLVFQNEAVYDFGPSNVWPLLHSYCFDVSVWEIMSSLLFGGKLCVVDADKRRNFPAINQLLVEEKVSILNQTPTAFYNLANEVIEKNNDLPHLRHVIFAGEKLEFSKLSAWSDRFPHVELVNMYGITEITVHASHYVLPQDNLPFESVIGRPLSSLEFYVLNEELQRCPVGVPGELYVSGRGLARGYIHQQRLTAERFLPDAYGELGARMYRSGDAAKYLPNGELVYLGRLDKQVKVRGFRIELDEIEITLRKITGVKDAVVVAKGEPSQLIAYIVSDEYEIKYETIREEISRKLPEYMVPSLFSKIDALPLNSNGKIDYQALPEPDISQQIESNYKEPKTDIERNLCDAWQSILSLEKVGVSDNFFAIGGDSIRAIEAVGRSKDLGLPHSVKDLFIYQTIESLLIAIENGETENTDLQKISRFELLANDELTDIQTRLDMDVVEDAYPQSKLQQGMILLNMRSDVEGMYHDIFSFKLQMTWNTHHFTEALKDVVKRHETLRIKFDFSGKKPLQIVLKDIDLPIEYINLMDEDDITQDDLVNRWMENEKSCDFDLSSPAWRVVIHRLKEDVFYYHLSFHHAILDGWSVATLNSELFQYYSDKLHEIIPKNASLPAPLNQYIALEQNSLNSYKSKSFWLDYLNNAKTPWWTGGDTAQSIELKQSCSDHSTRKLSAIAKSLGVQEKSVYLTIHMVLMSMISADNDVVTSFVSHSRPETSGSEKTLGLFLNSLPFRLQDVSGSYADIIRKVDRDLVLITGERHYPVSEIQRLTELDFSGSLFNYLDFHVYDNVDVEDDINVLSVNAFEKTNYAIKLEFTRGSDLQPLSFALIADQAVFNMAQLEIIRDYINEIVDTVAKDEFCDINKYSLLGTDYHKQLSYWNNTEKSYDKNVCIHQLFEDQVAKTPDALAISDGVENLTYQELEIQANKLAQLLVSKGAEPERLIAVCLERSVDLMIAIFAILKSGAAYLPVDPEYPDARIEFMLNDSMPALLITDSQLLKNIPEISTLYLDTQRELIDSQLPSRCNIDVSSTNLVYTIYTSGSTGNPKGVMLEHASLVNRIQWHNEVFNINDCDVVFQKTPASFDVAGWEFFCALVTGARVFIAEPGGHRDPDYLAETVEKENVTAMHFVPSMLEIFLSEDRQKQCQSLKQVFMSGEALTHSLTRRATKDYDIKFHNLYGPTEAAIDVSHWDCDNFSEDNTIIPIGRPIANIRTYILDKAMCPVPLFVPGDIYVGGIGVGRGYLGQKEITDKAFIQKDLSLYGIDDTTIYKTGDRGVFLDDGNIQFLGRQDDQIKIRGLRIEIGEIESKILHIESIGQCAVVVQNKDVSPRLVAFIVAVNNDIKIDSRLLIESTKLHLSKVLPDHMVPAVFEVCEKLPITPSGKVDKKNLSTRTISSTTTSLDEKPKTAIELKICHVFKELLALDDVSVNDNFFELGGDSIMVLRAVSAVKKVGIPVSVQHFYKYQTIQEMANGLEMETGESISSSMSASSGEFTLTPIQKRFFDLDLSIPNQYNYTMMFDTSVSVDTDMISQAFSAFLKHHDTLRVLFKKSKNEWVGTYNDYDANALKDYMTCHQLTADDDITPTQYIQSILGEEQSNLIFDRNLVKLVFCAKDNSPGKILFIVHHLLIDVVSLKILTEDFASIMSQLSNQEAINVPSNTTSYKHWSETLQKLLSSKWIDEEKLFWMDQFTGDHEPLYQDTQVSKNHLGTHATTEKVIVKWNVDQTDNLLSVCKKHYRSSIDEILITALTKALSAWSVEYNQPGDSFVINMESHGRVPFLDAFERDDVDLSRSIGWFTSIYPLVLKQVKDLEHTDLLDKVKTRYRGVSELGIGYGILRYLSKDDSLRKQNYGEGDIVFNYMGQADNQKLEPTVNDYPTAQFEENKGDNDWDISPSNDVISDSINSQNSREFLIGFNGFVSGGELIFTIDYSRDNYHEHTMEILASYFKQSVSDMISKTWVSTFSSVFEDDLESEEMDGEEFVI